jgi:hypothetical protein
MLLGDLAKMGNFELCQQYVGTLIQNSSMHQLKMECNVSANHPMVGVREVAAGYSNDTGD